MDLVTIDEARAQLQIDADGANGSPHDAWLAIWIPAISGAVMAWLKDEWRAFALERDTDGKPLLDSNDEPIPLVDSNGIRTVLPMVKGAVLVELAQQFRYREGTDAAQVPAHWGHGYTLGIGATALLTPLRKTTIA